MAPAVGGLQAGYNVPNPSARVNYVANPSSARL